MWIQKCIRQKLFNALTSVGTHNPPYMFSRYQDTCAPKAKCRQFSTIATNLIWRSEHYYKQVVIIKYSIKNTEALELTLIVTLVGNGIPSLMSLVFSLKSLQNCPICTFLWEKNICTVYIRDELWGPCLDIARSLHCRHASMHFILFYSVIICCGTCQTIMARWLRT